MRKRWSVGGRWHGRGSECG